MNVFSARKRNEETKSGFVYVHRDSMDPCLAGEGGETPMLWRVAGFSFPKKVLLLIHFQAKQLKTQGKKKILPLSRICCTVWRGLTLTSCSPFLAWRTTIKQEHRENNFCSLISFHTRCSHIYSHLPSSPSPAKSVCSCCFCSQHQSYWTELLAEGLH